MEIIKLSYVVLTACFVSGCAGIAQQMDARASSCAARGGVLTGMGCEGGGASPISVGNAPALDRYGQRNFDQQGQYIGGHGNGTLVDRPPSEPVAHAPMPDNVVCNTNASGNAGRCVSQ